MENRKHTFLEEFVPQDGIHAHFREDSHYSSTNLIISQIFLIGVVDSVVYHIEVCMNLFKPTTSGNV